jgi:predicted transcriptional regulator
MAETDDQNALLIGLTADIASAYVSNNSVTPNDLPNLIKSIFGALTGVDTSLAEPAQPQTPAVSIKKSITDDYLICLEDGRRFKSLKRHLRTKYSLSPEDYRAKWGLASSYPMVAPAYAAARSNLAKQMGLGQGGRQAEKEEPVAAKPRAKATPKA